MKIQTFSPQRTIKYLFLILMILLSLISVGCTQSTESDNPQSVESSEPPVTATPMVESLQETPEPTLEPTPTLEPVSVDILGTMSDADKKLLNTFFSNFVEVSVTDFDADSYNDTELIHFAIWHMYRNNYQSIQYGGEYATIPEKEINSVIERYFGITNITPCDVDEYEKYSNGQYRFMPADGGSPIYYANVTAFYDNGDGTFQAVGDITYNDFSDDDSGEITIGTFTATVAPHQWNSKPTYKLLKYQYKAN